MAESSVGGAWLGLGFAELGNWGGGCRGSGGLVDVGPSWPAHGGARRWWWPMEGGGAEGWQRRFRVQVSFFFFLNVKEKKKRKREIKGKLRQKLQ